VSESLRLAEALLNLDELDSLSLVDVSLRAADELRRLHAEIERLRVDARRLDLLESDKCTSVFEIGGRWYIRAGYGRPHHRAKNIRAAIDAALDQMKDTP
jgi:uncharacterized membrane protein